MILTTNTLPWKPHIPYETNQKYYMGQTPLPKSPAANNAPGLSVVIDTTTVISLLFPDSLYNQQKLTAEHPGGSRSVSKPLYTQPKSNHRRHKPAEGLTDLRIHLFTSLDEAYTTRRRIKFRSEGCVYL